MFEAVSIMQASFGPKRQVNTTRLSPSVLISEYPSVLRCLCVLTAVYAVAQNEPKLVKINDSISMAMMASNVYLVTTPDGNIVIDTAPARQAATAKQLLSAAWP